ncbi:MAG TPA: hypothetical protein VMG35_00160 [Bryobacteraceae bacterium]|nr:hypothetical protein [Bryobacteraceae bacterium]
MQHAVGLANLLLEQLQLLPRPVVRGRQHKIQIVGAGIDHAERLTEVVDEAADHGPDDLLEAISVGDGKI